MLHIKVDNLKLNNKIISLEILKNEVLGVYSKDIESLEKFLLILSGINNNNNSCFFKEKNIFDNKEYFQNRLYLDFNTTYTTTLKKEYIKETFLNRLGLSFDTEKFKENIKTLKIRQETTINVDYTYTKLGNTLVNYSLLDSLNTKNIIILSPIANLNLDERRKIIIDGICNKNRYESIILGLDNLTFFNGKLDKVLFLLDNEAILLSSKQELLVIEDNINLKKVLYKSRDNFVICLNDFNKDELKEFSKKKIKYSIISIYDIDKYIGSEYEK